MHANDPRISVNSWLDRHGFLHMKHTNLHYLELTEIACLVQTRKVSPVQDTRTSVVAPLITDPPGGPIRASFSGTVRPLLLPPATSSEPP